MTRRSALAWVSVILASLFGGSGCRGWVAPTVQPQTTLLISAAASLRDALRAIAPQFAQKYPQIRVNYNFGASGALQRQIEQGAPADVFISAAAKPMDALERANLLLPGSRRHLLRNRLVLIVPRTSPLQLNQFEKLADPQVKRIAVGEFRTVPAGQYAQEVLQHLGILAQVQPKLVFGNNVRSVLAAVETGNADAGIVYATDAKISAKVRIGATAPKQSHSPIVYPMAILQNSKPLDAAKAYAAFLQGAQAKSVFSQFGFEFEEVSYNLSPAI